MNNTSCSKFGLGNIQAMGESALDRAFEKLAALVERGNSAAEAALLEIGAEMRRRVAVEMQMAA